MRRGASSAAAALARDAEGAVGAWSTVPVSAHATTIATIVLAARTGVRRRMCNLQWDAGRCRDARAPCELAGRRTLGLLKRVGSAGDGTTNGAIPGWGC